MTPAEAAKILEVSPDATPEQLEARFVDLRRKLEDKIAKAPTPGLQAKYRESLAQITTAFETLVLAADSSSLPVLNKSVAGGADPGQKRQAPAPGSPPSATVPSGKKRKGSFEFLIVAAVAVAVLGGGAWFILQTRAENAEKARLAEIARQEQLAAVAAAKAKAEEEARVAKAKADEDARQAVRLRTALAEHDVAWDAAQDDLRQAERRASDAKSELRSLRDVPPLKRSEAADLCTRHEIYTEWLRGYLQKHPARLARARAGQLLEARELEAAAEAVAEVATGMEQLATEMQEAKEYYFTRTSRVRITSTPASRYTFTDHLGRESKGDAPAILKVPASHLERDFRHPGNLVPLSDRDTKSTHFWLSLPGSSIPNWNPELTPGEETLLDHQFPMTTLRVESVPRGIPFTATNGIGYRATGTTPANLENVPTDHLITVTLSRSGYQDVSDKVEVVKGKPAEIRLIQHSQDVVVEIAENNTKVSVNRSVIGTGRRVELPTLPPGQHELTLECPGYPVYRTKFKVTQTNTALRLNYRFADLVVENLKCQKCSGRGQFTERRSCPSCDGRGWYPWENCCNNGYWDGKICTHCGGDNRVECDGDGRDRCRGDGVINPVWSCADCAGDGKVSRLQLGI